MKKPGLLTLEQAKWLRGRTEALLSDGKWVLDLSMRRSLPLGDRSPFVVVAYEIAIEELTAKPCEDCEHWQEAREAYIPLHGMVTDEPAHCAHLTDLGFCPKGRWERNDDD